MQITQSLNVSFLQEGQHTANHLGEGGCSANNSIKHTLLLHHMGLCMLLCVSCTRRFYVLEHVAKQFYPVQQYGQEEAHW